MAFFYNLNGNILPYLPGQFPLLNGSTIHFGEGVFETIRFAENGRIPLFDYHWSRLDRSIQYITFNRPPSFNKEYLLSQIQDTVSANKIPGSSRARVTVFYDQNHEFTSLPMHFIVEAQPLAETYLYWNKGGISLVHFRQIQKQLTNSSSLKLNNRIPYNEALNFAKSEGADDAVVFNSSGAICDTSIANIFWIKNDVIYTPPLSDGPVAGVMRNWLLEHLPRYRYKVNEVSGREQDIREADEIFLTNALYGIRQVSHFSGKHLNFRKTKEIYYKLILPLFSTDKKQG
ncbi:aminotransferase class IV [Pollutibacter soli]|uniref:aminotransferase class IV n=1 Tax=Pollutibacter soli TaxID=3034157 RepID=UPI003013BAD3